MNKHTPGPWKLGRRDTQTVYDEEGKEIALAFTRDSDGGVGSDPRMRHEALANARLIAAAPQMLQALQAFLAHDYMADPDEMDRDLIAQIQEAASAATRNV
jgi:hypothetical protein